MGWWSIGDDDVMGDGPADHVQDELATTCRALQARGVVARIPVPELVTQVEQRAGVVIATALDAAIRERLAEEGATPAETEVPGWIVSNHVVGVLDALRGEWAQAVGRAPRPGEIVAAWMFVLRVRPEDYLLVARPVEPVVSTHPLAGAPRATLDDLRRIDPELLDTALRAARLRVGLEARRPPGTLRSTDLFRAFQVGPWRGGDAPFGVDLAATWAGQTAAVTAALAADPTPPPEVPLDPEWEPVVRAWRHAGGSRLEAALDRAALAAVVPHAALYVDGLVTADEVVDRVVRSLEEAGVRWPGVAPATDIGRLPRNPDGSVGRPRELDLLALWLAARGASGTPAFTFWELLEAFAAADEADRWTLDWSRLRPWAAVPSRATRLVAACKRALRGRGEPPDDGVFLRFVQTNERLRQLVALDDELP